MRRFLTAVAAIAIGLSLTAAPAVAASSSAKAAPAGPYKLDAKGKCHAANGAFVAKSMCAAPVVKKQQCKDAKGKFAKCGTPGAKPI